MSRRERKRGYPRREWKLPHAPEGENTLAVARMSAEDYTAAATGSPLVAMALKNHVARERRWRASAAGAQSAMRACRCQHPRAGAGSADSVSEKNRGAPAKHQPSEEVI